MTTNRTTVPFRANLWIMAYALPTLTVASAPEAYSDGTSAARFLYDNLQDDLEPFSYELSLGGELNWVDDG